MLSNINAKHTLQCGLPLTLAASPALAQAAAKAETTEAGHPENHDTWILSKVMSKLATSGVIDEHALDIRVEHGVVHLRGTTGTLGEKDEAIRLARATEGVDRVDARGLRVAGEAF